MVDRYGREGGSFVAPDGTPFGARALPPSSASAPYNRYRVVKPIEVDGGTTAPWFQQPGLGTQYELPSSVRDLLRSGHLERISP
ncbi:MAG: TNT domain-containing protein [Pirellulales bacterium]|nr:TNT domain-containing protein [Pirellulales bacterium]